jgi:hypothetical protein
MRLAAIVGKSAIEDVNVVYDSCSKVQFILFSNGYRACYGMNAGPTCDVGDNKWYA